MCVRKVCFLYNIVAFMLKIYLDLDFFDTFENKY